MITISRESRSYPTNLFGNIRGDSSGLKLREALKSQSIRDPLTHLYNRRYMEESLEREMHRCNRAGNGLGVIMSDVDHFKKFNDDYGHDAGDVVLVEFANLLNVYFRDSDIVCRYGGEEFIIIVPEAPKEIVLKRAQGVCEEIRDLEIIHGGKVLPSITASFGVAYMDGELDKGITLIKAADMSLYEAKNAGRNQVVMSKTSFNKRKNTTEQNFE